LETEPPMLYVGGGECPPPPPQEAIETSRTTVLNFVAIALVIDGAMRARGLIGIFLDLLFDGVD
jgi:hypothetical protein